MEENWLLYYMMWNIDSTLEFLKSNNVTKEDIMSNSTTGVNSLMYACSHGSITKEDILFKYNSYNCSLYYASSRYEILKLLIKQYNITKDDIITHLPDILINAFKTSQYYNTIPYLIQKYNLTKAELFAYPNGQCYQNLLICTFFWSYHSQYLQLIEILTQMNDRLTKEDILTKNKYGLSPYDIVVNNYIKEDHIYKFINNILYNSSIDDMIKDIIILL